MPPPPPPPSLADAGAAPIIEVRNLKAGYDNRIVFENVSFNVRRGEIFVILGGSGCGKSTLLKHMIGLLAPLQGETLIDGADINRVSGRDRRQVLRKFGVAFQNGALFGNMTLLENVRMPMEEFTDLPREAMDLMCRMKLELVGLRDYADFAPADLSGGMRKRAAIARAIALDPDVVFLDEPSAGLDPVTSAGLDELIIRFSRLLGVTFVVVSHELASIFRIADRVIMLDREERGIIAEGDPERLREESPNPAVRRFFNREPEQPAAEDLGPGHEAAGIGEGPHPGAGVKGASHGAYIRKDEVRDMKDANDVHDVHNVHNIHEAPPEPEDQPPDEQEPRHP